MLLFTPVKPDQLDAVGRDGLHARRGTPIRLYQHLADAQHKSAPVLVVDPMRLEGDVELREGHTERTEVPREAIVNIDPYRPPIPIFAAGGYVIRRGEDEAEVLLIFRRGVWDLPKGKVNPDESLEAGALREVREEVGIAALRMRRPLGTTVHGYPEGDVYRVKTTYWFLMETPERFFMPEALENIQEVAWVPWSEAVKKIGYETLRRHMEEVGPVVVSPNEGERR